MTDARTRPGPLHRAALALERLADRALAGPRSRRVPRHLAAYRAYAAHGRVVFEGRVLADPRLSGPLVDHSAWRNLADTIRRFATREVAGVDVEVHYGGHVARATSDEEGYYRAELAVDATPGEALWQEACVRLADGSLEAVQPVLVPGPEAEFAVVSDIDDTVLESSITQLATAAKLTFLHNARTRKPLDGVAALYRALQKGRGHAPRNPICYVSSSPWNLYDLLDDFMTLNEIPHGPILLRDLGLDETKFLKSRGHGHKLEHVRELLAAWPRLRFVLIGDSGQEDPMLYAQAAKEFGPRIAAIYVRDVDPLLASPRDAVVERHRATAEAAGVPFLAVKDSAQIAEHATSLGLLPPPAASKVEVDVAKDQRRPGLGTAAVQSAVGVPPRDGS